MNPRHLPNRRAGLTLIEVVLAMIILGSGLVATLVLSGQSMHAAGVTKQYEDARNLMAEIDYRFPIQWEDIEGSDGDEESGSFDRPYHIYNWERSIQRVGEEEDNLYLVETRVLWKAAKKARKEMKQTLVHLPSAKSDGYIDEDAVDY